MIADLALRTNGPYQGASVPACGTISSALVWKGRRTIRVGAGHEHQKTLAGLDVTLAALSGTALGASAPSQASVTRDQHFDWRLTDPNQDSPLVIWNFSLVRAQGVGLCQREDAGETAIQASYDLDQRPVAGTVSMPQAACPLRQK
jgi:hypothetical protein